MSDRKSITEDVWKTVIWLYFALKIFRAVLISYAPHIIYETRVKVSLLKNILAFNFVQTAAYEIK